MSDRQKGVALITVLFMFAVVAVVLSTMVVNHQMNMSRAARYFDGRQAYLLCLSGEEMARQLLAEDLKSDVGRDIDHLNEAWAESGMVYRVENGYIELVIEDATGKFNINSLVNAGTENPKFKQAFSNMLAIQLEEPELAEEIASQLVDWLDADKENGTEEGDYQSFEPPYQPPNAPVANTSELIWLKTVDPAIYRVIRDEMKDELVALPTPKRVNINTVSPLVLAGLTGISLKAAQTMVENIKSQKEGYQTVADAIGGAPGIDQSLFGVNSDTFRVRVRAKYGDQYAYLETLLFRDAKDGGGFEIISRDKGQRFIFPFSEDYNERRRSSEYEIKI